MPETVTLTATEASRAFSELLHRVCYGGESFLIKKGSRLMARVVPVEAVVPETVAGAPADVAKEIVENISENMSQDEAEFYAAWMEQVRKVDSPIDF